MKYKIGRSHIVRTTTLAAVIAVLFLSSAGAQTRKEFRFSVGAGSLVSINNPHGSVNVRPASGNKVTITATQASDKTEVDVEQTGSRIQAHTHMLQKTEADQARIDYDLTVPADASITIDSSSGQIKIENIRGNVNVELDAGSVEVRGLTNSSIHIQTVNGNVTLADIRSDNLTVTSMGGAIQMTSVTGPMISVHTTSGMIRYVGDFSGGGSYKFKNYSGDIEVSIPAKTSIDLTARSKTGKVDTDFSFRKKEHPGFALNEGHAFFGTSFSGASSVELSSFSGRIRVTKQQ